MTTTHNQNNALRTILWGLLLTKCFALEYFATAYSAPINTTLYVWALSILMASVATAVHLKLKFEEGVGRSGISTIQAVWIGAGLLIFLLLIAQNQLEAISQQIYLPITALIIGACCTTQGLMLRQLHDVALGFGWSIGAAVLFRTESPGNYLVFSICIFALQVIPAFVGLLSRRHQKKLVV